MGITGLLDYVRKRDAQAVKEFNLSIFAGCKISFDIACVCYARKSRFISDNADKIDLIYQDVNKESASAYMIEKSLKFFSNILIANVVPVCVFDGPPPALKDNEKAKRKETSDERKRRIDELRRIGRGIMELTSGQPTTFQLTQADTTFLQTEFPTPINNIEDLRKRLLTEVKGYIVITREEHVILQNIFRALGFPVVVAYSEGEQTCAAMARRKHVAAAYTIDSDALMYRCPIMIHDIKSQTQYKVARSPMAKCYIFNNVLNSMQLSEAQFVDFCIMNGTDFNPRAPGNGPPKNIEFLLKYQNIPNIINAIMYCRWKRDTGQGVNKEESKLADVNYESWNYQEVKDFVMIEVEYDVESLTPKLLDYNVESVLKKLQEFLDPKVFDLILSICKMIVMKFPGVVAKLRH